MAEKEYIEREAAIKLFKGDNQSEFYQFEVVHRLRSIPAADVRPVVFCRDCEYWQSDGGWCGYFDIGMNIDDFCSRERRRKADGE